MLGGMTKREQTFYVAGFICGGPIFAVVLVSTDPGNAMLYGYGGIIAIVSWCIGIYFGKKPTDSDGSADET